MYKDREDIKQNGILRDLRICHERRENHILQRIINQRADEIIEECKKRHCHVRDVKVKEWALMGFIER